MNCIFIKTAVITSNLIFKMLNNSGCSGSSVLDPYVLKYRNRALKVTNTITIVVRGLRVLIGQISIYRRFECVFCVHLQGFVRSVVTFLQHYTAAVVLWVRWLVADLSSRRSGFDPRPFHVGFMVDKVLLGSLFLRVLWFPLVSFHEHSIVLFHSSDIIYI